MKSHEDNHEEISSRKNHKDAKPLQASGMENTANPKIRRKNANEPITTYDGGDLRGIVAKAQAESTDLYRALLESDVIKKAAEFFNCDDL